MRNLSFIIICGCLLCAASATAQTYSGGNGTENNPYLIFSNADMVTLAVAVNNGTDYSQGKYFLLTQNLSGINTVIGNSTSGDTKAFQGIFDGGGYTLEVNYLNSIIGIFGNANGATIKNMTTTGRFGYSTSETAAGICVIAINSVFINCINEASVSGSSVHCNLRQQANTQLPSAT